MDEGAVAATLTVEPFAGQASEWDSFVRATAGSSFCHLFAWKGILGEVLGHACHYLAARDATGALQGVLPLVRVRSRVFGDYLVSMPFLNYGGPVGSEPACAALAEAARHRAEELSVDLLELRSRVEVDAPSLTPAHRKLTVLKDLPETTEELWEKGLKSKVRSQVRRGMKEELRAERGPHLLTDFYRVFSRTMRDLGTPVLTRRLFEEIRDRMADDAEFTVVYLGSEPVAAGCGFFWGDEFEITWAGAAREHSRIAPNMFLYWSLMEGCTARGIKVFNFGRCSPGSSTHRFKSQWGTRDQVLPWSQWTSGDSSATPTPDSAKFRAAVAVWSRLPLPVANAIGPILSRSIP